MSNSLNKDLRSKTNEQLVELITKLKTQLLEIRFDVASGEDGKQQNAKEIRKTIARAWTIINERKIGVNNGKK